MNQTFLIKSNLDGVTLEFLPAESKGSGYERSAFCVKLSGPTQTVTAEVYELELSPWKVYFQDLANSWKGWKGEKVRESLEAQLRLSATSDKTGHISLRVVLRGDHGRRDWRVEDTLEVDAGGLEHLSKSAAAFFEGR